MTSLPRLGSLVITKIDCPLWGHWDSSVSYYTKTPVESDTLLLVTDHDGHPDRTPETRLVHVIGPNNTTGWIYVSNISPTDLPVPPPIP